MLAKPAVPGGGDLLMRKVAVLWKNSLRRERAGSGRFDCSRAVFMRRTQASRAA